MENFQKIIKKIKILIVQTVSMLSLVGCSQVNTTSDIYQRIEEQTQSMGNRGATKVNITQAALDACSALKRPAPFVIIGSILIGILILRVVKEEQAIRKAAWCVFIVGIPIVYILVAYGFAFVVGWFL